MNLWDFSADSLNVQDKQGTQNKNKKNSCGSFRQQYSVKNQGCVNFWTGSFLYIQLVFSLVD